MEEKIKIPEEIEIEINKGKVMARSEKGKLEKDLFHPMIEFIKENNEIKIISKTDRKNIKALIGTYKSHIENMIKGLTEGFEYKLKAIYEHFPMTLETKNNQFLIHNFLGEKNPRKAKILKGVEVKIDEHDIILNGMDKEKTGQTAANIEKASNPGGKKDRRVFSDGIYIVEKP